MSSSQQFCLKWNNHMGNMMEVLRGLLSTGSLVDVTLACEGLSLKCHRVVLSACSPFFKALFLDNPCQHPIVILKDIRYSELKAIVDFMYHGEVNVAQDQLPSLMKTAETLRVKGLAEVEKEAVGAASSSPATKRRKGRTRKRSQGSDEDEPRSKQALADDAGSNSYHKEHPEVEEPTSGDEVVYDSTSTSDEIHRNARSSEGQRRPRTADHSGMPSESFSSNQSHPSSPLDSKGEVLDLDADLSPGGSGDNSMFMDQSPGPSSFSDTSTALVPQDTSQSQGRSRRARSSTERKRKPVKMVFVPEKKHQLVISKKHRKDYFCPDCTFSTNDSAKFKAHMHKHNKRRLKIALKKSPKIRSCGQCDFTCDNLPQMKEHRAEHDLEAPASAAGNRKPKPVLNCEHCSYTCDKAARLKQHLLMHSGVKPFQCPICLKHFTTNANMKTHSWAVHQVCLDDPQNPDNAPVAQEGQQQQSTQEQQQSSQEQQQSSQEQQHAQLIQEL